MCMLNFLYKIIIVRTLNKARIIQTHATEKFELEHASGDPIRTEGQAWAAELCDLLEVFRGYIENFSFILVQCSIDTWKRVATLYRIA